MRGRTLGNSPGAGGVHEDAGLRVRLLGGFDLQLDGVPLEPIASARARSLLGHLILHDRVAHPRQRLAFLLWPDSTEAQARTNLRNLLHTLRRACPELEAHLEVTTHHLRWMPRAPVWVDVHEVEVALAEADAAPAGSDERLDALRASVAAYGGDLLDGCWDDWIAEDRDRLRRRHQGALRALAGELLELGGTAKAVGAVDAARALLRADALDEDAHRLLVVAHAAAGDRSGAVRAFHECAATLRRELGIDPSARTVAAYEAATRRTDDDDASPASGIGSTGLVGREQAWSRLAGCWEATVRGRAHLALVTGEPGIGKTRLVEEVARWCGQHGATSAGARAYSAEGELGHGLVTAWLRSPDVRPRLDRLAPAERTELARLVPELDPTGLAPGAPDDPDQRRRLHEAMSRVLGDPERPTVLVADDLQWADRSSLEALHHLLRWNPAAPLLVLATARNEELDRDHPLHLLVGGLSALDAVTEIALDRLTTEQTGQLASDLLGHELDDRVVSHLAADTEGNPLFVVEAIRAGWDGSGTPRVGLSPRLHAVVAARLQHLSEPARTLLGVAATVGRAFPVTLVGHATGFDDLGLARSLDELWRRGLIREHDPEGYDFSHGRLRDVTLDQLSPAARRRNHRLVAEALQVHHADGVDAVSGQIAAAYEAAGMTDEAVTWYQRAALEARRRYADVEALALLERARAVLPRLPDPDRLPRELEVVSQLPTVLLGIEGYGSDRVAAAQQRALDVSAELDVEPAPPVLRSLVLSQLCRDDFEGARATASRLARSAAASGDDGLAVESEYLLGVSAFWAGDLPAAREHLAAVCNGDAPIDPDHVLRFGQDPKVVCRSRLANALWFLGHGDEARAVRAEAVEAATRTSHPVTRRVTHTFAALLALDLGEPDDVERYGSLLDDDLAHGPFALNSEAFEGLAMVCNGRSADGLARIRGTIEACGARNPAPGFRATLHRVLLAAAEVCGDPGAALEAADEARALASTCLWSPEAERVRALAVRGLGATATEVDAGLARAAELARRMGAAGPARRVAEARTQAT